MTVSIAELTRVFGRIGVLSFGGPAAQIALMHKELVDDRPWLTEKQYLNALSFCMLLPGPEAMQLATYAGWRLRGMIGGLIAGGLFVIPGAVVMLAIALLYANYGAQPAVQDVFLGIKAAVVVIVFQALFKLSGRALTRASSYVIAILAFVGIFVFQIPFPLIIVAAAIFGALSRSGSVETAPELDQTTGQTLRVVGIGAAVWFLPVGLAAALGSDLLVEIGLFFSRLAVVTFGGAYAVLAYMTQEVVQNYGWLTTAQMMDGLGLAETTPGPLILVTEFVGTLAAFQAIGPGAALAGALMTLWVTFVPCYIWIFAGAPYIEWITHQPRLRGALEAITAAVVGVIANLSMWFAAHVFFAEIGTLEVGSGRPIWPVWSSFDVLAAGFALIAAVLLLIARWSLPLTLGVLGLAGGVLGALT